MERCYRSKKSSMEKNQSLIRYLEIRKLDSKLDISKTSIDLMFDAQQFEIMMIETYQ